jgi:hypothetical protein
MASPEVEDIKTVGRLVNRRPGMSTKEKGSTPANND